MTNENKAANKIAGISARAFKLQEMKEFQSSYDNLIKAYEVSSLAILSTINIKELSEFQEWKPYLLANKEKTMPLLVSKMLNGDIFAFSIYKELTLHTIDYDIVHSNKNIDDELKSYGGAEDGLAIVNARHWLETKESAEIFSNFSDGKRVECEVNKMLNIHNEFVGCSPNLDN